MTQRVLQSNFLSGQLASTFKLRRDDKRYYQGAELIKNGIPLPTGGVTRRPPFKFVDTFTNFPSLMIPWQSSPSKSYLITVEPAASTVGFKIFKRTGGTTTQVHNFSSSLSRGTHVWPKASFAQSRDVMYIALPGIGNDIQVKKLINTGGDTDWDFENVQEIDGPFDDLNLNVNFKMLPSDNTGSITITAKLKNDITNFNYFDTDDVGKLIRIRHNVDPDGEAANYWGCAIITGLSGTPVGGLYPSVTADLQTFGDENELSFGNNAGTVNWRLGAFSAEKGYPNKVTIHQNRLWYGKSNRVMASRANDLERHSPTLPDEQNNHAQTADSAIDIKLLDLRAETINWMHSDQVLHIGTNTGRYAAPSSSPLDFSVVKQSNVGVAGIDPVFIDNLIYVRYDREALLTADFNFRRDRFEDKSLNLNNDQILHEKVTRLATTNYPFNIIWCVLEDGTLASLTYDPEQEINAWATHSIQGMTINEIASLKAEDDKEVLYVTVNNIADGLPATVHLLELSLENIEYLQTGDYPGDKLLDAYIDLSDTAAVSGETQFSGNTIMAVKDGVNYPQTGTVNSSGNFTLASSITGDFHIGIPIDFQIKTFPVAIPQIPDAATSNIKDIDSVDIGLHRTGSCQIQFSESDYVESIEFRKTSDDVDKVPPFRNKIYNVPVETDSDNELSLTISQDTQAPITVLGLSYNIQVEDLR